MALDDSSIGIIGGAGGPTIISVSGNPIKAMIIPVIVFVAIFLQVALLLVILSKASD